MESVFYAPPPILANESLQLRVIYVKWQLKQKLGAVSGIRHRAVIGTGSFQLVGDCCNKCEVLFEVKCRHDQIQDSFRELQ